MTTHQVTTRFNLLLANLIIEDNEATVAMFTDPNDEVFNELI